MKYDNILMNFEFEGSRAKVKVMYRFCCHFTQMFSMKIIWIKFKFQLSMAKVNVKVAVLRNMLLAVRCFHLWSDFDITSYKF